MSNQLIFVLFFSFITHLSHGGNNGIISNKSSIEVNTECPAFIQEFNANKDSFRIVINNCSSKYFYSKANDAGCQFGLLPVSRGGRWGYYNLNSCSEITPNLFDSAGVFKSSETANDDTLYFAKAIHNGQELIINEKGQYVFSALELSIYSKKGGKGLQYANDDGSLKYNITQPVYDNLSIEDLMSSTEGYGIFIAKKNGKYGMVNVVGKEVLPLEYDKIMVPDMEINDQFIAFITKDKNTGICNKLGKILVPCEYDKIMYYATTGITDDGIIRFAVRKNDKEGMYEVGKGLTFPCIYDEVFFVDNDGEGGELIVARNKKIIGLYPTPGSKRKPDEGYESILPLAQGLRLAKKAGKWGAVDSASNVVVAFNYEDIKYIDYKYLWVKQNDKWGNIDQKGNFLVQPTFDDIKGQQAPFIPAMQKKFWGLINEKGEPKTAFVYSRLSYNYDRKLWLMTMNKKEGILDDNGNQYLAADYDKIQEIYDDYIIVKKGEGLGAIDHKGIMIIDFKYSKLVPLKEDKFSAMIKKKCGVVDSKGTVILPFEFEDVYPDKASNYIVQKEGLKGLYSKEGKPVIPILYDKIIDFKDGICKANKAGKTVWVDVNGKEYSENPSKKKRRGGKTADEDKDQEKEKEKKKQKEKEEEED